MYWSLLATGSSYGFSYMFSGTHPKSFAEFAEVVAGDKYNNTVTYSTVDRINDWRPHVLQPLETFIDDWGKYLPMEWLPIYQKRRPHKTKNKQPVEATIDFNKLPLEFAKIVRDEYKALEGIYKRSALLRKMPRAVR